MTTSSVVAVPTASVGVTGTGEQIIDQPAERTLAEYEAVIERGLVAFVEVGQALLAIRDHKLYRETHATFQDYCRERWGMSRPYAYEVMAAAEVTKLVSGIPDIEPPSNAAQAAELARVKSDPELARETWREVREAKGAEATAADTKEIVDRKLGRQPRAPRQSKPSVTRSVDEFSQDIPDDLIGEPPPVDDDLIDNQEAFARPSKRRRCERCLDWIEDGAEDCPCPPPAANAFPYVYGQPCTACGGEVVVESIQAERAIKAPECERDAGGRRVTLLCEACQLGEANLSDRPGAAEATDPVGAGQSVATDAGEGPLPASTPALPASSMARPSSTPIASPGKSSGKPSSDRPAATHHPLIVDGKAPDPVYPTAEGYLNGIESHLTSEALDEFAQRFAAYYRDVQRRRGQTVTNEQPAGAASVADLDTAASTLSPERQLSLISRIGKRLTADQLHRAATFFEAQARLLETREQLAAAGARL